MADLSDGAGDLRRAISGALDIAGNFLGGGALLLDPRRYRGGDLGNLADGRTDHLDRADRLLGRGLHARDLDADFVGRLGGLTGERLDLLGDHGEAAAGFAGARRLDGGVEREKIGLLGDRGDQLDHIPDPVGGLRQRIDARVGFIDLLHGAQGDAVGFLNLRRNLAYRAGKFFGRRRYR